MISSEVHTWCRWLIAVAAFSAACGGDDSERTPASGGDAGGDQDAGEDQFTSGGSAGGTLDCEPPGLDPLWVSIPAGSFAMGCSTGDDTCLLAESPTRTVTVEAFELMATEVTQAQYFAETGKNPSKYDGCDTCPVDSVKWAEAVAYCETLGGRLPTEAEWEYAARAGGSDAYVCGSSAGCLDVAAWYDQNASASTHEVASKTPNDLCLFDMAGNVWEWVRDCWHDTYDGAPASAGPWEDGDCTYRVQRGGAFGVSESELRVSSRGGDYPDIYFVPAPGFRCARSAE
jgi:formylglycine-generating enzyme required for sulfatase activity